MSILPVLIQVIFFFTVRITLKDLGTRHMILLFCQPYLSSMHVYEVVIGLKCTALTLTIQFNLLAKFLLSSVSSSG